MVNCELEMGEVKRLVLIVEMLEPIGLMEVAFVDFRCLSAVSRAELKGSVVVLIWRT